MSSRKEKTVSSRSARRSEDAAAFARDRHQRPQLPCSPACQSLHPSWQSGFSCLRVLLCCLLLLFGSLRPAHALDMDVLIGFGQSATHGARYRPDTWTPLTVYLTGSSMRAAGQIQITVTHAGQTTVTTRQIALRDGAMNAVEGFALNLHNTEWYGQQSVQELKVELIANGRSLASKKVPLPAPIDAATYTVLALARDSSGLNFLTVKKLGLIHRHVNPAILSNARRTMSGEDAKPAAIDPTATLQLLYTDARALPSLPQGYEAIDAIVLADQPLDSLTDSQMDAIKTYVRQGGLLLVSGGGDLFRLRSRFFADLLPVTPVSVTPTPTLPELETRYHIPLHLPTPTALTSGTLKPGAFSLFGGDNGSLPLVSALPYGAGRVVFTRFDFMEPTFRGWQAAPAFWRDLLRTGNDALSPRETLEAATMFGDAGQAMVDALAGKQAGSTPDWPLLTAFLLTYMFLLLPANYLLLKRADRREWGWLTVPLLVIAFTIGSFVIALSIKGGTLSANRVVVIETQANTGLAAAYGQMTLYSPRRTTYDISLESGSQSDARPFLLRDAFGYRGGKRDDLTLDSAPDLSAIRGAQIRLWDKRSFDSAFNVNLGDGLYIHTRSLTKNQVETVVANNTPYALHHCALVCDENFVSVPDLASGESSPPLVVSWANKSNVFHVTFSPAPNTLPYAFSATAKAEQARLPASTHDKMVRALADALAQGWDSNRYGYGEEAGRGNGRSLNAFIGWFEAPLMNPRINGSLPPRGEEVNVLFAHLPVPANAPPAMRKAENPFARRPILKLENQLPPGTRTMGGRD